MVLVTGYLVTIDPSFLSSPHPQPIPFFILSSTVLLGILFPVFLSFRLSSLSCISCPLSLNLSPLFYHSSLCSCCMLMFSVFFLFFHSPSLLLGFWPASRCFHIHPLLSLTLSHLSPSTSLSLHCPLISMQFAGQPCSASLSLSVGEEAA